MNLVSEYTEAAAPKSSGRCSSPVATVLSTTNGAPADAASAASAVRSATRSSGLVGVSAQSTAGPSPSAGPPRQGRAGRPPRRGPVRPQPGGQRPRVVVAVGREHDRPPPLRQGQHQRGRRGLPGGERHREGPGPSIAASADSRRPSRDSRCARTGPGARIA